MVLYLLPPQVVGGLPRLFKWRHRKVLPDVCDPPRDGAAWLVERFDAAPGDRFKIFAAGSDRLIFAGRIGDLGTLEAKESERCRTN
jgi:hypothetical protein